VDEFEDLEMELATNNRNHSLPGFLVSEGKFKNWKVYGNHPHFEHERVDSTANTIANLWIWGSLGIVFIPLSLVLFPFSLLLLFIVGVKYLWDFMMIKSELFLFVNCSSNYIYWDRNDRFAIPMKYDKVMMFTSEQIKSIVVEYNSRDTIHIKNYRNNNVHINFQPWLLTTPESLRRQMEQDKRDFTQVIRLIANIEPKWKYIAESTGS
jgi:hypothetical protein